MRNRRKLELLEKADGLGRYRAAWRRMGQVNGGPNKTAIQLDRR